MKLLLYTFIVLLSLSPQISGASIYDEGPSLYEVQKVALKYASLDPEDINRWKRRSRWSAVMPRLQFGFDRDTQNDVDVNISDSVSVTSSGVNIGPESNEINQNNDTSMGFEVKALWYLDRLVFNETELDISSEARYLVSERRQILKEVNQRFYDHQQLIAELKVLKNAKAPEDKIHEKQFMINRVVADLDAYTGGWFGRRISSNQ